MTLQVFKPRTNAWKKAKDGMWDSNDWIHVHVDFRKNGQFVSWTWTFKTTNWVGRSNDKDVLMVNSFVLQNIFAVVSMKSSAAQFACFDCYQLHLIFLYFYARSTCYRQHESPSDAACSLICSHRKCPDSARHPTRLLIIFIHFQLSSPLLQTHLQPCLLIHPAWNIIYHHCLRVKSRKSLELRVVTDVKQSNVAAHKDNCDWSRRCRHSSRGKPHIAKQLPRWYKSLEMILLNVRLPTSSNPGQY